MDGTRERLEEGGLLVGDVLEGEDLVLVAAGEESGKRGS